MRSLNEGATLSFRPVVPKISCYASKPRRRLVEAWIVGPHPDGLGLRDLHFSQFPGATYAVALGTFGDHQHGYKNRYTCEKMVSDETPKVLEKRSLRDSLKSYRQS